MAKVDVKDDHRICVRYIYTHFFPTQALFLPDTQTVKVQKHDHVGAAPRMQLGIGIVQQTPFLLGLGWNGIVRLAMRIWAGLHTWRAWGLMNFVFFGGNEFRPQHLHGTNPNRMTSQSQQTQVISQIHALLCKTKCCSPVWGGVSGHHWTVIMHSLLNGGTNSRMILLLTRGSTKISDCVLGVSHAMSQLRQLQGWILRGEFLHWGFTRKGTVSRHAKTCWEAFYSTSIQAFMNVKPGTWGCTMVHFSLAWICLLTIKLSKIWIISLRERWSDSE